MELVFGAMFMSTCKDEVLYSIFHFYEHSCLLWCLMQCGWTDLIPSFINIGVLKNVSVWLCLATCTILKLHGVYYRFKRARLVFIPEVFVVLLNGKFLMSQRMYVLCVVIMYVIIVWVVHVIQKWYVPCEID